MASNPWEADYTPNTQAQAGGNPWEPGYRTGNALVDSGPMAADRGEFAKGAASGVKQMEGMAYGLIGLLGDSVGHEGLTQWGLENYQRKGQEAQANAPRVGSIRDVQGVGDLFDYTAGVLGQTAPFSLTTFAGGGLGGLLASALGKRAILKGLGEKATKEAVERILKDQTKRAALTEMVKRGALTGSFAASAGAQQGDLWGQLKDAGVEDAALPAWIFGTMQGALDVAPEKLLADLFFPTKKVSQELTQSIQRGLSASLKRTGKVAATQVLAEGVTEGAQEALSVIARAVSDDKYDWKDAPERIIDNVVAGGIAGLFLGGGAGGLSELMGRREEGRANAPKPQAAPAAPQPEVTGEVLAPQPGDSAGLGAVGAAAEPGPAGPPANTGLAPAPVATADVAAPAAPMQQEAPAVAAQPAQPVETGAAPATVEIPVPTPRAGLQVAAALQQSGITVTARGNNLVVPAQHAAVVQQALAQLAPPAQEAASAAPQEEPVAIPVPTPRVGLQLSQAMQQNGITVVTRGNTLLVPPQHAELVRQAVAQMTQPTQEQAAPTPAATRPSRAQQLDREIANLDAEIERAVEESRRPAQIDGLRQMRSELAAERGGLDAAPSAADDLSMSPRHDSVMRVLEREIPSEYRASAMKWARDHIDQVVQRLDKKLPLTAVARYVLTESNGRDAANLYHRAKLNQQARDARTEQLARDREFQDLRQQIADTTDEEAVAEDGLTGLEDPRLTPAFIIGRDRGSPTVAPSPEGMINNHTTIIDGRRQRVQAKPWTGDTAEKDAKDAAELRQKQDSEATFVAEQMNADKAARHGLHGPGWYVVAYPRAAAELINSKKFGGKLTPTALTRASIAYASRHFHALSQEDKHPAHPDAPLYGIHFTRYIGDQAQEKGSTLMAEDIVQLGMDLEPSLQNSDLNASDRMLRALYKGIAAITDYEHDGVRLRATALENGNGLPANVVLRQRRRDGGLPAVTIGDALRSLRKVPASDPRRIAGYEFENNEALGNEFGMESDKNDELRSAMSPPRELSAPVFDRTPQMPNVMYNEETGDYAPFTLDDEGQIVEGDAQATPDTRGFDTEEAQNRRSKQEMDPGNTTGSVQAKGNSAIGTVGGGSAQLAPQADLAPQDRTQVEIRDTKYAATVRNVARTIAGLLNIKASFAVVDTLDAAVRLGRERGFDPAAVQAEFEAWQRRDTAARYLQRGDQAIIFVNPKLHGSPRYFKSLAHEIGHVFFNETWEQADPKLREALGKAYRAFADAHPNTLKRALAKGQAYDIEEWMADQVAAWAYTDKAPRSQLEKFFHDIAVKLQQIYDFLLNAGYKLDETAAEFIRTASGGRTSADSSARDDADVVHAADVMTFLRNNNVRATASDTNAADLFNKTATVDVTDPRKASRVAAEFAAALSLNHPLVRQLKLRIRQTALYKSAKRDGRSDSGATQHVVSALIENDLTGRGNAAYHESLRGLGSTVAEAVREGRQIVPNDRAPGTVKVDFADALARNPEGAAIVKAVMNADPRFALAGSLAVAAQADVYRNPDVMLHDIDFVFSGSGAEVESVMQRIFPNAIKTYRFTTAATNDVTTSFIVPPPGRRIEHMERRPGGKLVIGYTVVNETGKEVGRFEKDADSGKETYTGERAYPVDVFTHGVTEEQVANARSIEHDGVTYRVAPYASAIKAKLKYSRYKDSLDYAALRPTLDPSFDSLGVANSTRFDMNVDPIEPQGWQRDAWNKVRAMRAKNKTIDSFVSTGTDALKALNDVLFARVFKRVERMNIPAFNAIMRQFYNTVGDETVVDKAAGAATFFSDMDGWTARFGGALRDALEGMNELDKTNLLNLLLREEAIPEGHPLAAKATAVRNTLSEIRDYMLKAGLAIRNVANYMPHVYDLDAINHPDAAEEIRAAAELAGVVNPVSKKPYTLEEITKLLAGMRDGATAVNVDPGADPIAAGVVNAPWAQAMMHRSLDDALRKVIAGIPGEDGKPKYMTKSLDYVLSTYVRQSILRAEYNRRFGDPNYFQRLQQWEELDDAAKADGKKPEFDPHLLLKKAFAEAKGEGADDQQVRFMHEVMAAMLGQYGRIESPALRKVTNSVMLFQNMRTLVFTVFSSFPDLANIFIRTGDFKNTWAVMRKHAKAAWRGEYNDILRAYGHAADALDSTLMQDVIAARDSDGSIWKINEAFFKAIGLHKWTNFTRALGAKVAEDYITRHAEQAAAGNEDSVRRLAELGLTADHVAEWHANGKAAYFSTPLAGEGSRRVTAALQQMINDMVIHPTPPEKTLWGNSEVFKLVWHLKSFMYGFSTRVLGRAFHELKTHGLNSRQGFETVAALSLLLPLAAFGLFMRDLTQYWVWGAKSYTPYDDPLKYLWQLAGRSGVTGFGQMAVDTLQASSKGRAPLLALAGPTITQMNDFLEYPLYKTVPGAIPVINSIPGIRDEIRDALK